MASYSNRTLNYEIAAKKGTKASMIVPRPTAELMEHWPPDRFTRSQMKVSPRPDLAPSSLASNPVTPQSERLTGCLRESYGWTVLKDMPLREVGQFIKTPSVWPKNGL